eukprot:3228457-Rhodomonas_salina.1
MNYPHPESHAMGILSLHWRPRLRLCLYIGGRGSDSASTLAAETQTLPLHWRPRLRLCLYIGCRDSDSASTLAAELSGSDSLGILLWHPGPHPA